MPLLQQVGCDEQSSFPCSTRIVSIDSNILENFEAGNFTFSIKKSGNKTTFALFKQKVLQKSLEIKNYGEQSKIFSSVFEFAKVAKENNFLLKEKDEYQGKDPDETDQFTEGPLWEKTLNEYFADTQDFHENFTKFEEFCKSKGWDLEKIKKKLRDTANEFLERLNELELKEGTPEYTKRNEYEESEIENLNSEELIKLNKSMEKFYALYVSEEGNEGDGESGESEEEEEDLLNFELDEEGKEEAHEILQQFLVNIIENNQSGKSPQESLDQSIQTCIKSLNDLALRIKKGDQLKVYSLFEGWKIKPDKVFLMSFWRKSFFDNISEDQLTIDKIKSKFIEGYNITGRFFEETESLFYEFLLPIGFSDDFFSALKLKGETIFYEGSSALNTTDDRSTIDNKSFYKSNLDTRDTNSILIKEILDRVQTYQEAFLDGNKNNLSDLKKGFSDFQTVKDSEGKAQKNDFFFDIGQVFKKTGEKTKVKMYDMTHTFDGEFVKDTLKLLLQQTPAGLPYEEARETLKVFFFGENHKESTETFFFDKAFQSFIVEEPIEDVENVTDEENDDPDGAQIEEEIQKNNFVYFKKNSAVDEDYILFSKNTFILVNNGNQIVNTANFKQLFLFSEEAKILVNLDTTNGISRDEEKSEFMFEFREAVFFKSFPIALLEKYGATDISNELMFDFMQSKFQNFAVVEKNDEDWFGVQNILLQLPSDVTNILTDFKSLIKMYNNADLNPPTEPTVLDDVKNFEKWLKNSRKKLIDNALEDYDEIVTEELRQVSKIYDKYLTLFKIPSSDQERAFEKSKETIENYALKFNEAENLDVDYQKIIDAAFQNLLDKSYTDLIYSNEEADTTKNAEKKTKKLYALLYILEVLRYYVEFYNNPTENFSKDIMHKIFDYVSLTETENGRENIFFGEKAKDFFDDLQEKEDNDDITEKVNAPLFLKKGAPTTRRNAFETIEDPLHNFADFEGSVKMKPAEELVSSLYGDYLTFIGNQMEFLNKKKSFFESLEENKVFYIDYEKNKSGAPFTSFDFVLRDIKKEEAKFFLGEVVEFNVEGRQKFKAQIFDYRIETDNIVLQITFKNSKLSDDSVSKLQKFKFFEQKKKNFEDFRDFRLSSLHADTLEKYNLQFFLLFPAKQLLMDNRLFLNKNTFFEEKLQTTQNFLSKMPVRFTDETDESFLTKCKKDVRTEISNHEKTLTIIDDLTNFLKGLEKLLKENIASQNTVGQSETDEIKTDTKKNYSDEAEDLKNLYFFQNNILDNLKLLENTKFDDFGKAFSHMTSDDTFRVTTMQIVFEFLGVENIETETDNEETLKSYLRKKLANVYAGKIAIVSDGYGVFKEGEVIFAENEKFYLCTKDVNWQKPPKKIFFIDNKTIPDIKTEVDKKRKAAKQSDEQDLIKEFEELLLNEKQHNDRKGVKNIFIEELTKLYGNQFESVPDPENWQDFVEEEETKLYLYTVDDYNDLFNVIFHTVLGFSKENSPESIKIQEWSGIEEPWRLFQKQTNYTNIFSQTCKTDAFLENKWFKKSAFLDQKISNVIFFVEEAKPKEKADEEFLNLYENCLKSRISIENFENYKILSALKAQYKGEGLQDIGTFFENIMTKEILYERDIKNGVEIIPQRGLLDKISDELNTEKDNIIEFIGVSVRPDVFEVDSEEFDDLDAEDDNTSNKESGTSSEKLSESDADERKTPDTESGTSSDEDDTNSYFDNNYKIENYTAYTRKLERLNVDIKDKQIKKKIINDLIAAYAKLVSFLKIKISEEAKANLKVDSEKFDDSDDDVKKTPDMETETFEEKDTSTEKLEIDCVQTYKRLIELCGQAENKRDKSLYTTQMETFVTDNLKNSKIKDKLLESKCYLDENFDLFKYSYRTREGKEKTKSIHLNEKNFILIDDIGNDAIQAPTLPPFWNYLQDFSFAHFTKESFLTLTSEIFTLFFDLYHDENKSIPGWLFSNIRLICFFTNSLGVYKNMLSSRRVWMYKIYEESFKGQGTPLFTEDANWTANQISKIREFQFDFVGKIMQTFKQNMDDLLLFDFFSFFEMNAPDYERETIDRNGNILEYFTLGVFEPNDEKIIQNLDLYFQSEKEKKKFATILLIKFFFYDSVYVKNSYTTEAKSEIFNPDLHMMSKTEMIKYLKKQSFFFMQNPKTAEAIYNKNIVRGNKLQLIGLDLNDFEEQTKKRTKIHRKKVRENFLKQIQFIDDFRSAITKHDLDNSGLNAFDTKYSNVKNNIFLQRDDMNYRKIKIAIENVIELAGVLEEHCNTLELENQFSPVLNLFSQSPFRGFKQKRKLIKFNVAKKLIQDACSDAQSNYEEFAINGATQKEINELPAKIDNIGEGRPDQKFKELKNIFLDVMKTMISSKMQKDEEGAATTTGSENKDNPGAGNPDSLLPSQEKNEGERLFLKKYFYFISLYLDKENIFSEVFFDKELKSRIKELQRKAQNEKENEKNPERFFYNTFEIRAKNVFLEGQLILENGNIAEFNRESPLCTNRNRVIYQNTLRRLREKGDWIKFSYIHKNSLAWDCNCKLVISGTNKCELVATKNILPTQALVCHSVIATTYENSFSAKFSDDLLYYCTSQNIIEPPTSQSFLSSSSDSSSDEGEEEFESFSTDVTSSDDEGRGTL